MQYYARLLDPSTPNTGQRLEEHLQGVAHKAATFAQMFGAGDLAQCAGFWHDLGKYHPDFQAKLRGKNIHFEHSGAGASQAYRCFKKDPRLFLPLCFSIAGHHAGLANQTTSKVGGPSLLGDRITRNDSVLSDIMANIPDEILNQKVSLPSFLDKNPEGKKEKEIAHFARRLEFFTRFLFSALVDADRLDAACFTDPSRSEIADLYDPLDTLNAKLDEYIDRKLASLSDTRRNAVINVARAQILQACRSAANLDLGCFSLSVPTGGGKTLSGMSFALRHALAHGLRRVIVVIPYTSIIEQNAQEYRRVFGAKNVVEHHSNFDADRANASGEYNEDIAKAHEFSVENWDAPIIVTTTVQFFESLFSNRPSACRKLHNIARSVIVLDEVQSLPQEFLLAILEGMKELTENYGCSIVLSTATPPALKHRDALPDGLENVREIVSDSADLAGSLQRVSYAWPKPDQASLSWEELAGFLGNEPQVLCVVNRRADARELAQRLMSVTAPEEVFHLSALMCPAHRSDVLAVVRKRLQENKPCRLISTQLIEAGVDIDFPCVYRALAGLDSIVQAAGRCNREGRLAQGRVIVFSAPSPPPKGILTRAAQTTESMLREFDGLIDVGNPEIFETYFQRLYFAGQPDAKRVQTYRQQFDFYSTARAFKIIDDDNTRTIIVPYEPPHESRQANPESILKEIQQSESDKSPVRRLQPFGVSVYEPHFNELLSNGALLELWNGGFVLSKESRHLYSNTFGLCSSNDFVQGVLTV